MRVIRHVQREAKERALGRFASVDVDDVRNDLEGIKRDGERQHHVERPYARWRAQFRQQQRPLVHQERCVLEVGEDREQRDQREPDDEALALRAPLEQEAGSPPSGGHASYQQAVSHAPRQIEDVARQQ
jgi:hypothetical protein